MECYTMSKLELASMYRMQIAQLNVMIDKAKSQEEKKALETKKQNYINFEKELELSPLA